MADAPPPRPAAPWREDVDVFMGDEPPPRPAAQWREDVDVVMADASPPRSVAPWGEDMDVFMGDGPPPRPVAQWREDVVMADAPPLGATGLEGSRHRRMPLPARVQPRIPGADSSIWWHPYGYDTRPNRPGRRSGPGQQQQVPRQPQPPQPPFQPPQLPQLPAAVIPRGGRIRTVTYTIEYLDDEIPHGRPGEPRTRDQVD